MQLGSEGLQYLNRWHTCLVEPHGEAESVGNGIRLGYTDAWALGQTEAGRYLRVVYVPDDDGEGVFVVTAYPIGGKQLQAFRRRRRRRGR